MNETDDEVNKLRIIMFNQKNMESKLDRNYGCSKLCLSSLGANIHLFSAMFKIAGKIGNPCKRRKTLNSNQHGEG